VRSDISDELKDLLREAIEILCRKGTFTTTSALED
jgi:hypothetical protein